MSFQEGEKFVVKVSVEPNAEQSLVTTQCGRLHKYRAVTRALLSALAGEEAAYFDATIYNRRLRVLGRRRENDQSW